MLNDIYSSLVHGRIVQIFHRAWSYEDNTIVSFKLTNVIL